MLPIVRGLAWSGALALVLWAPPSRARSEAECRYTLRQAYSGALRYLRVDLGYEVTEKDPNAAYLLFKYRSGRDREDTYGSVELIRAADRVKISVTLASLPMSHEALLSEGLLRKLQSDYGAPPEPKRAKPPAKKDGDSGDGDKGDKGEKDGKNGKQREQDPPSEEEPTEPEEIEEPD